MKPRNFSKKPTTKSPDLHSQKTTKDPQKLYDRYLEYVMRQDALGLLSTDEKKLLYAVAEILIKVQDQ